MLHLIRKLNDKKIPSDLYSNKDERCYWLRNEKDKFSRKFSALVYINWIRGRLPKPELNRSSESLSWVLGYVRWVKLYLVMSLAFASVPSPLGFPTPHACETNKCAPVEVSSLFQWLYLHFGVSWGFATRRKKIYVNFCVFRCTILKVFLCCRYIKNIEII